MLNLHVRCLHKSKLLGMFFAFLEPPPPSLLLASHDYEGHEGELFVKCPLPFSSSRYLFKKKLSQTSFAYRLILYELINCDSSVSYFWI